ncbi:MAG: M4 family metallopeptidase [Bacteroidetes bacterium]|nr:M4 family metallopeptidase [Bacteroidota bacterium]
MKRLNITLLTIFLFTNVFSQQSFYGESAKQKFEASKEVYINNSFNLPGYVSFEKPIKANIDEFASSLIRKFNFDPQNHFVKYNEETDDLGMVHTRFHQYFGDFYIEGSMLIIHSRDGKIESFNGEYYPVKNINIKGYFNKEICLEKLISKDKIYAWQAENEQNLLREIENNPNATWYPKGELVVCAVNNNLEKADFRLTWKFDIYSIEPHERQYIFVDAFKNEIINTQKILCETDVKGKAIGKYAGTQTITVDSINSSSYRLRETGRGGGVDTYDNSSGTDFYDNNNVWDSTTSARQATAADLHFGTEKTFDYYKKSHNRNSYDNNNAKMIAILGGNFVNAYWNGTYSTYGMGNGSSWGPVTGIDVVGHEFTHGVTQKSSNLVYSGEPGSLNESFSDIFGKLVEWYGLPSKFTWYIGRFGAGSNKGFRNMSNPNEFGCPDTYGGKYWNAGDIVHYNSSVQNFWFYLLCKGGSGTNDSNMTYNVDSIGFVNAAKVAYRNNTYYLTTNSKFNDARFYAIKAAEDIFGQCTREIEAVTNAWQAVGVGRGYTTPAGKPKGTTIKPYNDRYCSTDSVITLNFTNPYNYQAIKYRWTFGDGDSSTQNNPTHTFKGYNIYKVILRTEYCFKYYYDTTIITISQKPIVDFKIENPDVQCLDRNKFTFTSLAYSKLKRKITLKWDSNPLSLSSSDSVVNIVFSSPSVYNIRLVATDDRGCLNEVTKQIEILESPKIDFGFKNACPKQNIAFSSINLPDTNNLKYTLNWDLAEGDKATGEKAMKSFNSFGNYKIKLILDAHYNTCNDTVIKNLTIFKEPFADFTYDSICTGVETRFIRTKSNDTLNYFEWNFGIYKPSDKDTVKYAFTTAGTYQVSLKVVSMKCISNITKQITVHPNPVAQFTAHDVCENISQKFVNNSYITNGSIKKYEWNFGDGSTSVDFEPDKHYGTHGNYTVKLKVSDQRGCIGTSNFNLNVFSLPTSEFTSEDVCFGLNLNTINNSTDPQGNVLSYKWFVNGSFFDSKKNITIQKPAIGLYKIKLETKNDKGCYTETEKEFKVKSIPNSSFTGLNSLYCIGESPLLQPFTNGGTWFLNFLPLSPTFKFLTIGNYNFKYLIEKDGCKDSSSQSTFVIEAPVIDLGTEQRYCEDKEITIDATQTNTNSYSWNTGENTPTIKVNKTGMYAVNVNHRCKTLKDSVKISIFGDECEWYLPNAFSPNGDGINDEFDIKGRIFKEIEIVVYNRLYQKIYQYKGPYKSWNGTMSDGRTIEMGTYPCKITLTGFNNEIIEENMALTIVK